LCDEKKRGEASKNKNKVSRVFVKSSIVPTITVADAYVASHQGDSQTPRQDRDPCPMPSKVTGIESDRRVHAQKIRALVKD
jgi:hypothetical protein